jgi:hypothetical protein
MYANWTLRALFTSLKCSWLTRPVSHLWVSSSSDHSPPRSNFLRLYVLVSVEVAWAWTILPQRSTDSPVLGSLFLLCHTVRPGTSEFHWILLDGAVCQLHYVPVRIFQSPAVSWHRLLELWLCKLEKFFNWWLLLTHPDSGSAKRYSWCCRGTWLDVLVCWRMVGASMQRLDYGVNLLSWWTISDHVKEPNAEDKHR